MKILLTLVALSSSIISSGCATVATKSHGGWGVPYSGLRCDAMLTPHEADLHYSLVVDYPLTIVADTLVLPVDLIMRKDPEVVHCKRES